MSLEEKRTILEELERIEQAVSQRFERDPEIYRPSSSDIPLLSSKTKRPYPQTLLQRHEIKQFLQRYQAQREKLLNFNEDHDRNKHMDDFDKLYRVTVEKHNRINQLGLNANEIEEADAHKFELFTSSDELSDTKRRRILSRYSKGLKITNIYSPNEGLGKFLDLKDLYRTWSSLPKHKPTNTDMPPTYKDYLGKIQDFYDENYDKGSSEYQLYIQQLADYLRSYYIKLHPLKSTDLEIESIRKEFSCKVELEDSSVYCLICQKKFTKESVYSSHLNGKKHTKNATKSQVISVAESEYLATRLLKLLNKQLNATILEVDRFEGLSSRERQIELRETQNLSDYEYDTIDEQETSKPSEGNEYAQGKFDDVSNFPIGPDGKPMPLWLWKLKGLDMEYSCEICGNALIKGREVFQNHFKEERHLQGLRMLGVVEDFNAFKDLDRIDDVLKLLEFLMKKKRNDIQYRDDGVEIEDSEGNVMSKKVYDQLKKQGLL
ncbi:hypothetical protein OGAPHI_002283 [Ogataea philodendri]|uniref:Matrin-type domain-containing protein n=1 Tax=Ogataea philodendri TaxID=1378263 RepID=A0A9P8PBP4_9ASCO|nr:uncharacterized protein OGAPHI_002283 [Ogataea philodendri]KAH3668529.1 hypothetical protein OGAPHI_002283 [Ogataea philodendri]